MREPKVKDGERCCLWCGKRPVQRLYCCAEHRELHRKKEAKSSKSDKSNKKEGKNTDNDQLHTTVKKVDGKIIISLELPNHMIPMLGGISGLNSVDFNEIFNSLLTHNNSNPEKAKYREIDLSPIDVQIEKSGRDEIVLNTRYDVAKRLKFTEQCDAIKKHLEMLYFKTQMLKDLKSQLILLNDKNKYEE